MKDEITGIKIDNLYVRRLDFRLKKPYGGGPLPPLKIEFDYEAKFPETTRLDAMLKVRLKGGNPPHDFLLDLEMMGVFSKSGEGEPTLESFSKYNAPAHLYPFVREAVATVLSKSSYPSLLLPPMNFVEFLQRSQEGREKEEETGQV